MDKSLCLVSFTVYIFMPGMSIEERLFISEPELCDKTSMYFKWFAFNHLSPNPTKWLCWRMVLSVFHHFMGLALKGLKYLTNVLKYCCQVKRTWKGWDLNSFLKNMPHKKIGINMIFWKLGREPRRNFLHILEFVTLIQLNYDKILTLAVFVFLAHKKIKYGTSSSLFWYFDTLINRTLINY